MSNLTFDRDFMVSSSLSIEVDKNGDETYTLHILRLPKGHVYCPGCGATEYVDFRYQINSFEALGSKETEPYHNDFGDKQKARTEKFRCKGCGTEFDALKEVIDLRPTHDEDEEED
jgi:transposase-like protein